MCLDETAGMTRALRQWTGARWGVDALVEGVVKMSGHSGINFGFDLVRPSAPQPRERLVLRVPPAGVRRQGNTDVLRQVPVLEALADEAVPVPRPRYWGDDEHLGGPYLMVERLPGQALSVFESDHAFDLSPGAARELFKQAVAALVRIHSAPWLPRLRDWAPTRTLTDEIHQWEPILARAPDPGWITHGLTVRDQLLDSLPPEPEPALVHGDFYSNNWIFDRGQLTAIVDWELAGIGPPLLDLGWLCMWYDADSWGPVRPITAGWAPTPEELVACYEDVTGRRANDIRWYQALAAYRFAAITAFNLRLHRSGRRDDPVWEKFGASFASLLRHAEELLVRR